MREVPVVRVLVQPFVEVLFRTEEIIDYSPTPLLDENRLGILMGDHTVADREENAVGAMAAGIFDLDGFTGVLCAVDQQQKVNRSPPGIEDRFALDMHRVETMAQGATPLAGPFRQSVA